MWILYNNKRCLCLCGVITTCLAEKVLKSRSFPDKHVEERKYEEKEEDEEEDEDNDDDAEDDEEDGGK